MKGRLQAKKLGYMVRYVPHKVIADYNATYNVEYEGQHIITGASKRLGTPLNEIWISELWKPYEEYILFHELREIHHRRNGLTPKNAHEKAIEDTPERWKKNPEFERMAAEIKKMDAITAKKKRK
jgi:competence protein ComEA